MTNAVNQETMDSTAKLHAVYAGEASTANAVSQAVVLLLICASIAIAFYKGFRLPNSWSTNYFQVSVFDGIFRRSFLGTLLYPLGCARFSYSVVATIQMFVFGASVATLVWQGMKAKLGLLVAIFFLSAAGGFAFNVLGYPEFIMYMATAGAIALIASGRYVPAAIIGALTLLTHEMAVFTTLPLLALSSIFIERKIAWRKLALLLAPAGLLFAVQLTWFQTYPDATLAAYVAERVKCGYPLIRTDYLDVLTNAYQSRTGIYFSPSQKIFYIPPLALLALAIGHTLSAQFKNRVLVAAAIVVACLSPLMLGLAAWDTNRWLTMAVLNSLVVMIVAARLAPSRRAPALAEPTVLAAFILVAAMLHIDYFELTPRTLDDAGLQAFKVYMRVGIHEVPAR